MIWWFQVRSFILTLPPSNIDFVDAGGVSEKLCKIPDDFSKDKFLIDVLQGIFCILHDITNHFYFCALMTIKSRSTKKSHFEASPTNVAILPSIQSEIRNENTQEANQLLH